MNQEVNDIIEFWKNSSDNDFEVMMSMYKSGHYSWSLFIGHLVVEKLLKAYYIKVNKSDPPFTHDLRKLAKECNLEFEDFSIDDFDTITKFNIAARYADYKNNFYKLSDKNFTEIWINKIIEISKWIKSKL